MTTVALYAGAAAAAGTDKVQLDTSPRTIGDLEDALMALPSADATLASTLKACSFLVDGVATKDRAHRITDARTIDVLPPFAGG
ncbi:MoaD/ThiS family protein [Actinomycetaceae bacterium WB03_NA08]|uniref:MoaD/ThiS family protein n=1 Tax=Scrofimicrobium canadense TaxID=2652290 RepID=A0A6N7WAK6_9ACTO|nr:MoaD/ThiS family protein [Scrofimicrobium canadense]MSS85198.1 MoaD/ThiS family protein [Scrofimicrobium canadense]